jgi:hypothetical protein
MDQNKQKKEKGAFQSPVGCRLFRTEDVWSMGAPRVEPSVHK